jgi:hypothetical protein
MAVGRLETIAVFLPIVLIVGAVGWNVNNLRLESRARNATALAAGFADATEMAAASAAGIADPAIYRARVEADRAKTAADDAARAEADRIRIAGENVDNAIRERNRKAAEEAGAVLLRERNRDPGERMTMASFSWTRGGFGVVGSATVTIDNGNDFPVKDIDARCDFSGKSGTELSTSRRTIFDTIPAKAKRTFKDVNMGFIHSRSAKANCRVETAKRL